MAYGDTWDMRWQRIVLLLWNQIPLPLLHTMGLIIKQGASGAWHFQKIAYISQRYYMPADFELTFKTI